MATKYINSITYGGNEYKFVDDSSIDGITVFPLTTSSYTIGELTDFSTMGVSVSSSEVADIDAAYDTTVIGVKFNFGDYNILAYSNKERFAVSTSDDPPVTFSNIMKFEFAGDYLNAINQIFSDTKYVGCLYIVPTVNRAFVSCKNISACIDGITSNVSDFTFWEPEAGNMTMTVTAGYGDTVNPYDAKTANYVLAAPNGSAGSPSFRALVSADIPALGNIQNTGSLQTSDITIATGDKLVVTDSSDSNKVARASVSFDTSDTSKYLRHDGTWQTVSGGVTDVKVDNASVVSSGVASLVTSSSHPYNASTNALATMADIGAAGGGTVTSVGLSNATNGGLTISGSPVTSSGSITVGHTNVLANAQTTSAVYPIKIDKNGHISEYGSAVTIPTVTDSYSSTGTDAVSGKAVSAALQTLDSSVTATTGEAISAITITDGKITGSSKIAVGTGTVTGVTAGSGLSGGTISTSGTIGLDTAYGDTVNPYGSKTANQVLAAPNGSNGTPSFRALASADIPALGNIQNTGALQTSDITIATGDKLVVTDSSDSSKVARASISFDTSNTTDYLRKDGTWQTVSGGSSDVLMVTLSYSNSTYSIDSTYDDILQAVSDGKFVYLYDEVSSWADGSEGGFIIAPLSVHFPAEPAENEFDLYFVSSYTTGGNISFCRYVVDYDNYVWANDSIGVTSATSATSATNATNAYVTATNPTSATTYYPAWVNGVASANRGMRVNNGLSYYTLEGTTSEQGYGILKLGNNTASGTAGNKYGGIHLYGSTAYYTELRGAPVTANRTCHLPVLTATGYLLGKSSTSAVGSSTQLVYFSSTGIATAGMSVLSGTSAPTSSQGANGDIYIRY